MGFFLKTTKTGTIRKEGGSVMKLDEAQKIIRPVSDEWMKKAKERLDDLTKPRGSLGMLEELAARFVAIKEEIPITLPSKEIFVFVGDHDVVSEGVSAYPQEVTSLMVRNFLAGGAAINVLGRCVGATVSVIDIGMKENLEDAEGLIKKNVRRGARNIARGPAMTPEEAQRAIEVGIEMAEKAHINGAGMIATGEMGIGNTTPSAAIFSSLLPFDITGDRAVLSGRLLLAHPGPGGRLRRRRGGGREEGDLRTHPGPGERPNGRDRSVLRVVSESRHQHGTAASGLGVLRPGGRRRRRAPLQAAVQARRGPRHRGHPLPLLRWNDAGNTDVRRTHRVLDRP